jgi:hypothetical protein
MRNILSLPYLHWLSPGNGFNAIASSASVFASLLAGDCLTTNSYSSNCRLKTLTSGSWPSLYSLVTNRTENTANRSRVESYVTTDGQSVSLSWNKAPSLRSDFYYCQTVTGLLKWGALSDERTGLSFTTAAGPRQRSHSRARVPWDSWPHFTLRIETPSTWRARYPYLHPQERLTQLYPQALGFLFVASYGSQGYGGCNRPRLHAGYNTRYQQFFCCCITQL